MAINWTLLETRRVPSDEPRERRSTWSNMEEEDNCSSAPLPDAAPDTYMGSRVKCGLTRETGELS